ncbi:MAG TPA: hypothetical protein VHU19_14395 [Pyrinomonadaceae bacterium]|nr:hypothetical protein [Pyrinomonadaceae bacterium]
MGDEGEERRDYTALFIRLCDCAGPQPSTNNPRSDEHAATCPYRAEVEGGGNSRERCGGEKKEGNTYVVRNRYTRTTKGERASHAAAQQLCDRLNREHERAGSRHALAVRAAGEAINR